MLAQFKIRTQLRQGEIDKKGGCIISIVRTGTLPSGEIQDGLEDVDVVWDIDRWENDGGRSLGTSSRT
ncbi:hypothetical protein ABH968_004532 [Lysinibacillus sp. RC79]